MATNKNFRIRRGIVTALYEYAGPQNLDTVMCHTGLLIENPTADLVRAEWENLVALNLIEPLAGYPWVAKLTAGFRLQMQHNGGRPPVIEPLFGHEAL